MTDVAEVCVIVKGIFVFMFVCICVCFVAKRGGVGNLFELQKG